MEQNDVNNKRKCKNGKVQEIEGKTKKYKMEENQDETDQTQEIGWNSLPVEIEMYIFSFLLKTDHLKEMIDNKKDMVDIFSQLAILRSVSQQFRAMAFDKKTLEDIVEHLVRKAIADTEYNEYIFEMIIIAARRHPNLCSKLIEVGLAPRSNDALLLSAILFQKIERIHQLIESKRGVVSLVDNTHEMMLAAGVGNVGILKLFVTANLADIDKVNSRGETALMFAVFFKSREAVRFLLDQGANINARDNWGMTALMKAGVCAYWEIMKFLLQQGADINAKDSYERTVFMLAASSANKEIIDLLLDKGAIIDDIDKDGGTTALIYAAMAGNLEGTKALLGREANINHKDSCGRTAFLHAVQHRHEKVAELLLDKGSNINEQDDYGNTALIICANEGYETLLKFLLDRGADADIKNEYGETALDIAESQLKSLKSPDEEIKNKEQQIYKYESIIQCLKHHTDNRSYFIDSSFSNMD